MPWSPEQKSQTRQRILDSAAALFTAHGYDRVTLGDVMRGARLTHGAFYAHFPSKQALYAEAIASGARHSLQQRAALCGAAQEPWPIARMVQAYLDPSHARGEQSPCPLAFLVTDVANREAQVREAYTEVFQRLVAVLERQRRNAGHATESARQDALALAVLMIGGVAVARAVDDDGLAEALLAACRIQGGALLGAGESIRAGVDPA